jgi:hypothetical protein
MWTHTHCHSPCLPACLPVCLQVGAALITTPSEGSSRAQGDAVTAATAASLSPRWYSRSRSNVELLLFSRSNVELLLSREKLVQQQCCWKLWGGGCKGREASQCLRPGLIAIGKAVLTAVHSALDVAY